MSQKLLGFGLSGGGIVAVLFIIGFILIVSKVAAGLGSIALGAAIGIGILFGILGGIGIIKKLVG